MEELDRPCSERAVEHALACATRRGDAHRDETAVLVHGDVHQWNALEAGREFKLVDPDGLLAQPEYDLGIIMREDPLDGDLRERARWLAGKTGLDEEAIWEWGVVERVSTGLLGTRVGLQPIAREMLDAADHVAAWGGNVGLCRAASDRGPALRLWTCSVATTARTRGSSQRLPPWFISPPRGSRWHALCSRQDWS